LAVKLRTPWVIGESEQEGLGRESKGKKKRSELPETDDAMGDIYLQPAISRPGEDGTAKDAELVVPRSRNESAGNAGAEANGSPARECAAVAEGTM
jgi:hypothetical protein